MKKALCDRVSRSGFDREWRHSDLRDDKIAGLPLTQVPTLLLDTCASVEEAEAEYSCESRHADDDARASVDCGRQRKCHRL